MRRLHLLTALPVLALAGCMKAPLVVTPVAPPSAAGSFVEVGGGFSSTVPLPANWWRLFEDRALNAHVERALAANADLRAAIANLDTARASEQQTSAARLPTTMIESGLGPESASTQPSTSSVPKTSYDLGATFAYELDLFGRLRSASAAAQAEVEASRAALDTVRLAIVADVTAAYIDMCGANAGGAIAREQLATIERRRELQERQLRLGEISPLEVSQTQTIVERTRAALPAFEADRRRALYRLATLQGMTPADADTLEAECVAAPSIRSPIPVGDGAALLARRPDIREAEQRLAAATARIGVATAELYPQISLGGSAGLLSGGFDAILTPLITWAFPNQSAARARIASARASEQGALASWDATVLRSLREVETALADLRAERLREAALAASLDAAGVAERRAEARYRLGADGYLLVIDAMRTRQDAESQRIASDLRVAQLQVALFRALGGGWELPMANDGPGS